MTYINNVQSLDDLKSQYRALALKNHPDAGGSDEAMKAINAEYDALFPIWKHRDNVTSNETAASTRRAFYTEYGWQGERYDSNLTLKEIAVKVREFIKIYFNDFKFSVRTAYASMCQELRVAITEVPCEPYKSLSLFFVITFCVGVKYKYSLSLSFISVSLSVTTAAERTISKAR